MESIVNFIKKIFAKSERTKMRDKVLSEEIDFGNVVSSSLLAKQLYYELKVKVHPDRFQDPEIVSKATELFQHIHQSKGDYNKLLDLKERAYAELPIDKHKEVKLKQK
jgi:hypothetical protein